MKIIRGKQEKAQKVVVYGPEGIGKSTFASKFPNPLFIDTESSTTHLDVARFEKPTSWQMLIQQIQYVRDNKPCSTLVLDTADWAESLAKEYLINKDPNAKSIETLAGGYGKGYTMLAEEWGRLLNLLEEVIEVGIHVVLTAHAQIKRFESPTEIGAYDRWELKLEKKTAGITKEWGDMVLFANFEVDVLNVDNQGAMKGKNKARGSGKRIMNTSHMPAFDAKNRHGFPQELPFDYNQIGAAFKDFQKGVKSPVEAEKKPDTPKQKEPDIKTSEPVKAQEEVVLPPVSGPDLVNNIDAVSDKPFDDTGIEVFPKALQDLMRGDKITLKEIQDVVALKGYFPKDTPPQNYPTDFINGVLIGAWDQVRDMIIRERLPF